MARIVFMGTPDFAVPALRAVHERFGVVGVVTVPDKPQGRGRSIKPSAVKEAALELGIETILQPATLKDPGFQAQLSDLQPDILCVIAFRILPRDVYSMARIGAFNVHASLLPKFRGAAPINHAIIEGETVTGVTSFLLNDVVDTGSLLMQKQIPIADGTTAGDLYAQLMPLAAACAVETCQTLINGTAAPQSQDDALASPAPKVFRETAVIDWMQPRDRVRNHILGHSPTPGAWTTWNEEVLKVYHASLAEDTCKPGTFRIVGNRFVAGCADGALQLDEIQLPGKKRMPASEILRGYRGPTEGAFA